MTQTTQRALPIVCSQHAPSEVGLVQASPDETERVLPTPGLINWSQKDVLLPRRAHDLIEGKDELMILGFLVYDPDRIHGFVEGRRDGSEPGNRLAQLHRPSECDIV